MQNHWTNFNQTWHKLLNGVWRKLHFVQIRNWTLNSKIVKLHPRFTPPILIFFRIIEPDSTNWAQELRGGGDFKVLCMYPREDNSKIVTLQWHFLNVFFSRRSKPVSRNKKYLKQIAKLKGFKYVQMKEYALLHEEINVNSKDLSL